MSDGGAVAVAIIIAAALVLPPVLALVANVVAGLIVALIRIGAFVLIIGFVGVMGALLVVIAGGPSLLQL